MKTLKENANGILLCVLELVVGILLLIDPVGFTAAIIMIAGVLLLVMGVLNVIRYFKAGVGEAAMSQLLVKGLVGVLAGGFCVFRSDWFLVTFPVLTMLYGIGILLTGLGKVQLAVDLLRRKNKKWVWAAVNAAVSVLCAMVVLSSPFSTTAVLWMFTGIAFIVEAVFDFVTLLESRKGKDASV